MMRTSLRHRRLGGVAERVGPGGSCLHLGHLLTWEGRVISKTLSAQELECMSTGTRTRTSSKDISGTIDTVRAPESVDGFFQ